MKWLDKLFQKDDFLNELNKRPDLYQQFFEKIVGIADEKLWAKFILNPKFAISDEGVKQIGEEETKTDSIFKEAVEMGLNQVVLLTAYLQYATADPLFDQGKKKSYWISVVKNRKPVDSFPDHNAIANYLEKIGYIERLSD